MSILGNIMSAIFGTKAQAGELPTGAGSDVAAILDKMAADNPEKLDWKNSIVDLMKLLKLDFEHWRAQAARQGPELHRQHRRFRRDEHLAAPAGDAEARRQWRQGAGGFAEVLSAKAV